MTKELKPSSTFLRSPLKYYLLLERKKKIPKRTFGLFLSSFCEPSGVLGKTGGGTREILEGGTPSTIHFSVTSEVPLYFCLVLHVSVDESWRATLPTRDHTVPGSDENSLITQHPSPPILVIIFFFFFHCFDDTYFWQLWAAILVIIFLSSLSIYMYMYIPRRGFKVEYKTEKIKKNNVISSSIQSIFHCASSYWVIKCPKMHVHQTLGILRGSLSGVYQPID